MQKLIFIVFICLSTHLFAQEELVKIGQNVPAFNIPLEGGEQLNPNTLKGKIILINFFATWCGPCLAELPELQKKIWNKYKSNPNFSLLVIGRDHSKSEIETFKSEHHFDLPMYPDLGKKNYSLFANSYIPRNFIIDKDGTVVYTSLGYDEDEFNKMIKKLDKLLK